MGLELNDTRKQLIALLADGAFHSGESLADKLALSRAAIHNNIEAIEQLGLEVYRVKGKGYRLQRPITLLNEKLINAGRNAPLHLFWQIDSTNELLLAQRQQRQNGEVCMAEMQTAGRGRRGRTWISPPASHIYLSYFYRLEQGMTAAAGLSLAVGVMLAEGLAQAGFEEVELKWPNDLYISGRKLAGILIELNGQYGEPAEVVIGCGINVAMPDSASEAIGQPWTDLQSQQQSLIDRSELARLLLANLDEGMSQFAAAGLTPFIDKWQQRDCFVGKSVTLQLGEREIVGVAAGIDGQGNLLIDHQGERKAYASGEVSLRLT